MKNRMVIEAVCLGEARMFSSEKLLQGDEIAQGFSHFLSVDGDHIVVHPVFHGISAIGDARLCNF